MSNPITIKYAKAGTDSPVYIVTELSSPPWEVLPMHPTSQKTDFGGTVFARDFDDVPPGTYQYKIRIGDHHWLIDDTKLTGKLHLNHTPTYTPTRDPVDVK
jgi:hypothetical protein